MSECISHELNPERKFFRTAHIGPNVPNVYRIYPDDTQKRPPVSIQAKQKLRKNIQFCVAYSWPLCANMTLFVKLEVHNVSQHRQRKIDPGPYVISTKISENRTCSSGHILSRTDRQTDKTHRQAHHNTPLLTHRRRSNSKR